MIPTPEDVEKLAERCDAAAYEMAGSGGSTATVDVGTLWDIAAALRTLSEERGIYTAANGVLQAHVTILEAENASQRQALAHMERWAFDTEAEIAGLREMAAHDRTHLDMADARIRALEVENAALHRDNALLDADLAALRARLADATDRADAAAHYLSAETQRSAGIEAELERLRARLASGIEGWAHTASTYNGRQRYSFTSGMAAPFPRGEYESPNVPARLLILTPEEKT